MFKKDNFIIGILIGGLLPLMSWLIFDMWHKNWVTVNKPAVPYLVAILLNLFLLRIFYKRNADNTLQGLLTITFLFLIWTIFSKLSS